MILHWYLTPIPRLPNQSLQVPGSLLDRRACEKAAGGRGPVLLQKRRGLSGESSCIPPHPSQDFYHIYKYIHKYITYNRESGRQAPHRGSADTSLGNSREGAGLLAMGFACLLRPNECLAPAQSSSGSVCPVGRVAVSGFGGLRLGLQGAGLVALARAALGILWKMVV